MKKNLIKLAVFLLIGSATNGYAQQEPLYTQYMFNAMSVNPGYTGTQDALQIALLSRLQWTGLEGAPNTYAFSAHTPFTKYNMGLGIAMVADKIGPVNNYYFNVNYAYRVNITDNLILSMGIKGGIYNYYVGLDGLLLDGSDDDPSFQGQLERKFQPNAGAGFYLYNDRLYAGFSVPKFFQSKLDEPSVPDANVLAVLKRHYYIMAGYLFDLNPDLKFRPSFINKIVEGAPPSTDITAQFLYQDTYWLGATYRIGDAVAILANMQITDQLMVGYSYDFSISKLRTYNSGSHELMLSYKLEDFLGNKRFWNKGYR